MKDLYNPKNWINPKTKKRYRYFSQEGIGYDDTLKWAKHIEERDNKSIKQEYVFFGRFWISTVWLGLDHSWNENEPPLIFESMVFNSNHDGYDLDMNRYTTREEAIAGHQALVRKWSNPFFVAWYFLKKL